MEKNKYIALTLGPIGRVIDLAESTKELWAASYFFSYLAKNIIKDFAATEADLSNFLLPMIDQSMFKPAEGAGLFPDRYIFKSKEGDFQLLIDKVDSVLSDVASNICKLTKEKVFAKDVKSFLLSYLKIYFFEMEFENDVKPREIIQTCEKQLAFLEMQDSFNPTIKDKSNYLQELFRKVNGNILRKDKRFHGFEGSFLSNDAYGKTESKLFESVIEISAADLKPKLSEGSILNEKDESLDSDIQDQILKSKDLRPYHKYIAIVKADGDSIGKALEQIDDTRLLSKGLLEFNKEVVSIISEYKGKPVYIGGDDLLFFAPVCVRAGDAYKTIFDLIKEIDNCFKACLKRNVGKLDKYPTLSYGVSISYYKYPMFESLDNAGYLLDSIAKGKKKRECLKKGDVADGVVNLLPKNNLTFSLQKHSGQVLSTTIHKDLIPLFNRFVKLISSKIGVSDSEEDLQFISSVMYKIREMSPLIEFMMKESNKKELIHNFFENNFNEDVHKSSRPFFADIQSLLLDATDEIEVLYKCYNAELKKTDGNGEYLVDSAKEAIDLTYSTLRFIHFVNCKGNE